MRWEWIGAVGLLAGCSRDNPWFYLDQDDEATSTAAATSDGTPGDAASTAGIDDTANTPETADTTDATSGDSEAVIDTDATSTTTGETTTGVADTGGASDTGATGMTGETGMVDTTGGDPSEGKVWHDLWALCSANATDWQAYGIKPGGLACDMDFNKPEQWAGWFSPAFYMGEWVPQVLGIVPAVGQDNHITGTYGGLTLTQAKTPHLRTIVACPLNPPMCAIKGNIHVEQNGVTVVGEEDIYLGPGASTAIDIDLTPYPKLLDGTPFSVVFVVTSQSGGPGNRGAWLYPRIVEVTQ